MPQLLVLDADPAMVEMLRSRQARWGVTVDERDAAAAVRSLAAREEDVAAVVVGAVPDPIRTAQRSHRAAPDVPLVLLGTEAECEQLTEALRLTVGVGQDIRCLGLEPVEALLDAVANVIERARQRRRFRHTANSLNARLAGSRFEAPSAAAGILGRLFDVAPIGVVVTDEERRVRAVNNLGTALLGRSERSLLGSPLGGVLSERAWVTLGAVLDAVNGDPARQPSAVIEHEAEDRAFKLEVTGARLTEHSGGPGNLILFFDATERLRLIEELREAGRKKDEFLAMLGHELRNPLAPIRTALDLMELKADDTTASERAVIARQVSHMVELVDDLLDVTRITRGDLSLHREEIELAEIVDGAVAMVAPLLEEKQHALQVDVPREGLLIDGDPRRLVQVVTNILVNAAKYTPPAGEITVVADRADHEARLVVGDNGPGIPSEELARIFDLFVQGAQGIDRASGGLGIGLSIVQSLVELHGGRVSAKSEPGEGTELTVRLPLAHHVRSFEMEAPRRAPDKETYEGRVLIVDDNHDAARMLREVLVTFGLTVALAHDGPAALAEAERFRPDVVVLDIGLPVMDGYEVARRLRESPAMAKTRLVALSGYGDETDRDRSREAGFQEHLVKPIDTETLLGALAALRKT